MPLPLRYRPPVDALLDADPETPTADLVDAAVTVADPETRIDRDRLASEVEAERARYLRP